MARTRIVATIGPSTRMPTALAPLLDAGVDVVRLNMAHGSHAEHAETIATVRRVAGDRPIAILADLGGPKLRLEHAVSGRPGDVVPVRLPATVRAGDSVLLADGAMQLEVVDAGHARIVTGGAIPAGKGVNLPGSRLDLPALTDKDRADLAFAVAHGVDVVGLSFVATARDLAEAQAAGLPVVAKIERAVALDHLDEIVAAADGVMVARGDLGVEIAVERVPLVQKHVITLANRAGKPVITATQMLRSMVESPRPTRAEAADVANAVLDGTDAVMLSEETAIGRHPVEAVQTMQRILAHAETALAPRPAEGAGGVARAIATAACAMVERIGAQAIVVASRSGFTARMVAAERPRVPVFVFTPDGIVRRRLSLVWGVTTEVVPWCDEIGALLQAIRQRLRGGGRLAPGARFVFTAGWPLATPGLTNLLHIASV